ncbi:MAG: YidH family protein [Planktomarina sp.]
MSEESSTEKRTNWAEDRTIMANERTFSSWMGTGLACIGVAIGLKAVFGDFDPTWVAKTVASLFVMIAVYIFYSAQRQARRTFDRLTETDAEALPSRDFQKLAVFMSVASIATGAVLWAL